MALNFFDKYGPRATAPTVDYPQGGSVKNESIPGANDGTPLDKDQRDDLLGFDEALFAEVGLTVNNIPDTAQESQRLQAHLGLIAKKSGLVFGPDGVDSAIDLMISNAPINSICRTGSTLWKRVTSVSSDLSDFQLLSDFHAEDYGIPSGAPDDDTIKMNEVISTSKAYGRFAIFNGDNHICQNLLVTGENKIRFNNTVIDVPVSYKGKVLELLNAGNSEILGSLTVNGVRADHPGDTPPQGADQQGDIDIRNSDNITLGIFESIDGYNNGIVVVSCNNVEYEELKSETPRNIGVSIFGTGSNDAQTSTDIFGGKLEGNNSELFHGVRISGSRGVRASLARGANNANNGVLLETNSQNCFIGEIEVSGNTINGSKFQESTDCTAGKVTSRDNGNTGFAFIDSTGCHAENVIVTGNSVSGLTNNGVGVRDCVDNSVGKLTTIGNGSGAINEASGPGVVGPLIIGEIYSKGNDVGINSVNTQDIVPFIISAGEITGNTTRDISVNGANIPPVLSEVIYESGNQNFIDTLTPDSVSPTFRYGFDGYQTANTIATGITSLIPPQEPFRGVLYIRINDANTTFVNSGTGPNQIANSLSPVGGDVVACKKFGSFWTVSVL